MFLVRCGGDGRYNSITALVQDQPSPPPHNVHLLLAKQRPLLRLLTNPVVPASIPPRLLFLLHTLSHFILLPHTIPTVVYILHACSIPSVVHTLLARPPNLLPPPSLYILPHARMRSVRGIGRGLFFARVSEPRWHVDVDGVIASHSELSWFDDARGTAWRRCGHGAVVFIVRRRWLAVGEAMVGPVLVGGVRHWKDCRRVLR
jgi:hypothetical protein